MSKKKQIEKFNQLLKKYKSKRKLVKINRTVTEGESNIFGVILNTSSDFMQLVENPTDFRLDGEIIIRMDHFDSIRCNKFDKTTKRILKKENELSKEKPKRTKIDISSWESIFSDLMKKNIHAIIECEDLKEPTFTIGPIEKVNKKSVEIRNYDATGQLNNELSKIKYKDITLLKFNDAYSMTFRKYLKNPKNSDRT